jgi:hypothetical protein
MNVPFIIQASGFKKYTPNTGNTVPFNFCTMYLTEDCTVSVTDHYDNDENSVPFKAGYHPMLFKKIRTISNGLIYLCYNGKVPTLTEHLNNQGF